MGDYLAATNSENISPDIQFNFIIQSTTIYALKLYNDKIGIGRLIKMDDTLAGGLLLFFCWILSVLLIFFSLANYTADCRCSHKANEDIRKINKQNEQILDNTVIKTQFQLYRSRINALEMKCMH